MRDYQKRLTDLLAQSGSLFFQEGLKLKDGRPTPYFIDLGVFRSGRLALELGRCFADWLVDEGKAEDLDLVVGPSYKGSAIAQSTAIALYEQTGREICFDYDRKEAKTHGEASGHGVLFVTGAALQGGNALILDDVGSSMITKLELVKKLNWLKPRLEKPLNLMGVVLAVDREQTQPVYDDQGRLREGKRGPDAAQAFREETGLGVWSLLGINQAAQYLYDKGLEVLVEGRRQRLSKEQLEQLQEYLEIYGRQPA